MILYYSCKLCKYNWSAYKTEIKCRKCGSSKIEKGKEGGDDIVKVIVGKEVPHPNTVEHHIAWITLYGVKESGQIVELGYGSFAPVYAAPNVRLQVKLNDFNSLYAISYCNIHGVWENSVDIG